MKIAVHRITKTFPETASNANLSQSRQLQGPDDNMIERKVAKSSYIKMAQRFSNLFSRLVYHIVPKKIKTVFVQQD